MAAVLLTAIVCETQSVGVPHDVRSAPVFPILTGLSLSLSVCYCLFIGLFSVGLYRTGRERERVWEGEGELCCSPSSVF